MRKILFNLTLDDPTLEAGEEDIWVWQILGPSDREDDPTPWQFFFYSYDTGEVRIDGCQGLKELGKALANPKGLAGWPKP